MNDTITTARELIPAKAIARFQAKIVPTDNGCQEYRGALTSGYGRFWYDGKLVLAHRFAWAAAGREPAENLDHLCRNRSCVNVDHLESVTIGENVLRGIGITAINAKKTRCDHGHELTPENTYRRPDRETRSCITCNLQRTRAWRAAQRKGTATP